MKLSELTSLLEIVIFEEINKNQLISTAKALEISPDLLKSWVEKTDPTPNKSFSVWLLRGLKNGDIRVEDDMRIRGIIHRFIELRNVRRIEDIMQFPTINALETRVEQLAGQGSKRQGFAGIDPETLPGVTVVEKRPDLTLYKVSNANSLAKMGEGTKWCTRFSYGGDNNIAERYIKQYGYLMIGYKNGKPYVQLNPDYSQVMDVNDASFHYSNPQQAKLLNLPAPNIVNNIPDITPDDRKPFRTVKSREQRFKTPGQQELEHWLNYTTRRDPRWQEYIDYTPGVIPTTHGRDLDYENRVARAITKSIHPFHLMRVMEAFTKYAVGEIPGQRSHVIEKAILDKDYKPTQVAGKGGKGSGSRVKIPGIDDIISYVKNNIRGNWPEFEKKIENDASNSIRYYLSTNFNPDNIKDGIVKDLVLFAKFIKDRHPSVSGSEFESSIRDFMNRSRKELKYGQFSPVLDKVILPYMKLTKRMLNRIVSPELEKSLMRNASFAAGIDRLYKEWGIPIKPKRNADPDAY